MGLGRGLEEEVGMVLEEGAETGREPAGLMVAPWTPGLARAELSHGNFRNPSSSFGGSLWGGQSF